VTSRVLIPTQDFEGKMVAAHFGRAPYFVVIDLDELGTTIEIKIHPNTGEHSGGILVGKVMLMIMFYNTNHKQ